MFRVYDLGFRIQGLGFRVQGLGFRVKDQAAEDGRNLALRVQVCKCLGL